VHHDDAVGAGGDLLADGLGELLPDRRLHVLGEDVGDDAPAVVRAPGQIGDGSQHVLGVELGGDRAGPVVDGGGDGAAGRDERDRRQVAVEGDLGGLATARVSALVDVAGAGFEHFHVGFVAVDTDVVPPSSLTTRWS